MTYLQKIQNKKNLIAFSEAAANFKESLFALENCQKAIAQIGDKTKAFKRNLREETYQVGNAQLALNPNTVLADSKIQILIEERNEAQKIAAKALAVSEIFNKLLMESQSNEADEMTEMTTKYQELLDVYKLHVEMYKIEDWTA